MVAYLRIAPNPRFNQSLTISSAKSAHRFGCVSPVWPSRRPVRIDREPERAAMPISDMPIFSMLRTKMQWHQERQRLLAENVANADTPKFTPRDLVPLNFD